MKKNGLNKLLALLLALVMVLALAACGNKDQGNNGGAGDDANVVTDGVVADGATVGEGKTAFTVEVVQLDGTAIKFTVNTELLKNAGLESPFEENCLRTVCAAAEEWLDSYDMTGIL